MRNVVPVNESLYFCRTTVIKTTTSTNIEVQIKTAEGQKQTESGF